MLEAQIAAAKNAYRIAKPLVVTPLGEAKLLYNIGKATFNALTVPIEQTYPRSVFGRVMQGTGYRVLNPAITSAAVPVSLGAGLVWGGLGAWKAASLGPMRAVPLAGTVNETVSHSMRRAVDDMGATGALTIATSRLGRGV